MNHSLPWHALLGCDMATDISNGDFAYAEEYPSFWRPWHGLSKDFCCKWHYVLWGQEGGGSIFGEVGVLDFET